MSRVADIVAEDAEVPRIPMVAVVDDDEAVRTSTANLIRSFGFAADAFASGEELLRSPRLDATCCVMTDADAGNDRPRAADGAVGARPQPADHLHVTAYRGTDPARRPRCGRCGLFSKPLTAPP